MGLPIISLVRDAVIKGIAKPTTGGRTMNTLTQTRSKPHFPSIQPDMLQRLTLEAELRSSDKTDWDKLNLRGHATGQHSTAN